MRGKGTAGVCFLVFLSMRIFGMQAPAGRESPEAVSLAGPAIYGLFQYFAKESNNAI